ncbi:TetR/AcrR family transcriptional regulator [Tissierella sp. MB52-C2]|uniref:TetR/AcrR family transcriptional regulator n=1 Tax=Tissierella sp. MB52-C2 TaxID=3070999 RepID=UPI00280BA2AF|nr:TetR/AcrR family transcriptional regulator [Tissierella sp. MB52-C2]WMM24936.1 TetR/AcrR family transcriptional regulator [Tissierella sp. MB52-C2]
MKREEKNLLTRQRIIDSAIVEFGTNSYAEASLNAICKIGNISKGIIYHYFKDKDELYLVCVSECFHALTTFLNNGETVFCKFEEDMKRYLDMRHEFFDENPYYSNIFANAVLQPPKHLIEEIKKRKVELDTLNVNYYKSALQNVNLKNDISVEDAIEYFLIFQEGFNNYFQNKTYDNFRNLLNDQELKLSKLLKTMTYGIAQEDGK